MHVAHSARSINIWIPTKHQMVGGCPFEICNMNSLLSARLDTARGSKALLDCKTLVDVCAVDFCAIAHQVDWTAFCRHLQAAADAYAIDVFCHHNRRPWRICHRISAKWGAHNGQAGKRRGSPRSFASLDSEGCLGWWLGAELPFLAHEGVTELAADKPVEEQDVVSA